MFFIKGPSAAEFSVDSGGLPVLILNRGLGKPAPQLGIARFGDSGADATITFLSPTDLAAAAITTLQWPCSALLAFDGAQTSSCVWINSSAVLATFPSSVDAFVPLPSIGSLLSVKSGILRASCDGGITSSCSLNAVLNSAYGTFLAPFNPIIPFVSLVVPAGFNLLDDIIIDPTATRGGGGRPWAVVDWTASTDQTFNASASLLNRLLIAASQDLSLAFPLVIPSGDIPPALYIVTLRVTNFLNQSSSASASVNVKTINISLIETINIFLLIGHLFAFCPSDYHTREQRSIYHRRHSYFPSVLRATKQHSCWRTFDVYMERFSGERHTSGEHFLLEC